MEGKKRTIIIVIGVVLIIACLIIYFIFANKKYTITFDSDGGSVVDRDIDYDDGRKVYEFEIIKGQYEYEVDVLASSGKIIKFEKEYND